MFIELRARIEVTARSMAAFWMIGLEDEPERSAEICVAEIFGDAVDAGRSAAVGMGLHAFRDPAVTEDFEAIRLPIDASDFHTYAVDWTPERAEFLVDGRVNRRSLQPPAYPMQMMLAVFDFHEKSSGADEAAVPALVVDYLRGFS
jgi:beta-glucanase (GH16 family)